MFYVLYTVCVFTEGGRGGALRPLARLIASGCLPSRCVVSHGASASARCLGAHREANTRKSRIAISHRTLWYTLRAPLSAVWSRGGGSGMSPESWARHAGMIRFLFSCCFAPRRARLSALDLKNHRNSPNEKFLPHLSIPGIVPEVSVLDPKIRVLEYYG